MKYWAKSRENKNIGIFPEQFALFCVFVLQLTHDDDSFALSANQLLDGLNYSGTCIRRIKRFSEWSLVRKQLAFISN